MEGLSSGSGVGTSSITSRVDVIRIRIRAEEILDTGERLRGINALIGDHVLIMEVWMVGLDKIIDADDFRRLKDIKINFEDGGSQSE
jgi:hypothetical protein